MGEFAKGVGVWPAGLGPGSQVAEYRLERLVGTGGREAVFRARDKRLNRPVALKIFAPTLAADEGFRRRFLHESRLAAAVDDPHIIPIYDAGEADGVLFIAMRWVTGEDAGSLVRREGPLAPARVEAIISPVASALDAAHAVGLVHRDVKPANMLIDPRPRRAHVYLTDFGIGEGPLSSAGSTGSAQWVGTADYISPEQIAGEPVDGRADEYALACAAFELLTGAPPFRRDDVLAVIYAQVSEQPPLLSSRRPDLPPKADQVFARALDKRPSYRYSSCRDFANALAEALGVLPESGPDASAATDPLTGSVWSATAPAAGGLRPVDEDVRFTAYRPQVLYPERWASLLVFAHKTTPVVEPGRAPVDPVEEVEARARAHFSGTPPRPVSEDARQALPRGARLRIVPELPGIQCNPAEAEIEWSEPVHEVVFRLRAGPELAGIAVRGSIRVWCGVLIVAEVSIAIPIVAGGGTGDSPPLPERFGRYRKIFPSYSHRDRAVVERFAELIRALGDEYLRDVVALRAGERWHPRLLELIEEADVFQLFWSRNSMRSQHCRDEWEHALALQRPEFVRPLYWEEPRPEDPAQGLPPKALQALHFVKVPGAEPEPVRPPAPSRGDEPHDAAAAQPASPDTGEWPAVQGTGWPEPGQPPQGIPRDPYDAAPRRHRSSRAPLVLGALIAVLLVVAVIVVLQIAGR